MQNLKRFLPAILIGLLGFATLGTSLVLESRPASEAEYAEMVGSLANELGTRDAIIFVPIWAEKARLYLNPDVKVAGLDPDDSELAVYPRIWVLVTHSTPWFDTDEALAPLKTTRGEPAFSKRVGRLELLRFDRESGNGPPPPARLSDSLSQAHVRRGGKHCPFNATQGQHMCGMRPWHDVSTQIREFEYRPRQCIWAHPVEGENLEISFPGVQTGPHLEVRSGLVGNSAFDKAGAMVEMDVLVDEKLVGSHLNQPRPGLQTTRIPTPDIPETATITFIVRTSNHSRRHFCFDASVGRDE